MNKLNQRLREYIALRRALGFKLERDALLLPDFVRHLERRGSATITVELSVEWAKQPAGASSTWWAARLGMVRAFAQHLQAIDPRTEIPSRDLIPARVRRATPYLYSDHDIQRLMAKVRSMLSPFRGQTYAALIG